MTDPTSFIVQCQYLELLQTCHELFSIARACNALSRRDAQWYARTLGGCWDSSWQSWDEYLADCAEYY